MNLSLTREGEPSIANEMVMECVADECVAMGQCAYLPLPIFCRGREGGRDAKGQGQGLRAEKSSDAIREKREKSREQKAESREQRAEIRDQRGESREDRGQKE